MTLRLAITTAVLMLIVASAYSEDKTGFSPVAIPGENYIGSLEVENNLEINLQLPAGIPNELGDKLNYSSNATAEYFHQTIDATAEGVCLGAVRRFKRANFDIKLPENEYKGDGGLTGKKLYCRGLGALTLIRPKMEIKPEVLLAVRVDLEDPFKAFLPKTPVTANLIWQPDEEVVKKLIGALTGSYNKEGEADRISFSNLSAKVTSFTASKVQISSWFDAKLKIPVGPTSLEIPLKGTATIAYDPVKKGLVDGILTLEGRNKGSYDFNGFPIPYDLAYTNKLTLHREYSEPYSAAKGVTGKALLCPPSFEDAPMPVAVMADKLWILAAWDGSGNYEVLNKGVAASFATELPSAGAVSADGKNMVFAFGKKLCESSDYGATFTALKWAGAGVKSLAFGKFKNPTVVVECDDASFLLLDLSASKSLKKVTSPAANAKLLAVAPGTGDDELIIAVPKDYYYTSAKVKNGKVTDAPKADSKLMVPSRKGAILIADAIYEIADGKCTKLMTAPDDVVAVSEASDALYILNSKGEVSKLPLAGGEATPVASEVSGMAWRFEKLFTVKGDKVEVSAPGVK